MRLLDFWVPSYVEKFILCGAQKSTCYNSCRVIILASLGSLGYMCFLPTFHKTYLRKAREKTETKPFKRQPVYHQLAFTKKPFLGVSTVVSSYNFSSLLGTHRASFWTVGSSFWALVHRLWLLDIICSFGWILPLLFLSCSLLWLFVLG